MKDNKSSLPFIGLIQALGTAIYCSIIAWFFWYMANTSQEIPGVLNIALMLILLVFSAGVTGSIVFGYPIYLAMHKKVKEALYLLGYTSIYFVVIIAIVFFVLSA